MLSTQLTPTQYVVDFEYPSNPSCVQIPINLSISGNWTVAREMRLGFSMPNELKNYTLLDIEVHTVVS